MPAIFPLKGIRYASAAVGHLERVVTPPYDVISPASQAALYRRSPYNFVRVVYGRSQRADRPGRDQYSRARETFLGWMRQRILRQDRVPGCYPYRQQFVVQGRTYDRWGVLALIRLGDPTIFLHEQTYDGPKHDRLQLLQAVQANLSPIFGLVDDADRRYRALLATSAMRRPLMSAALNGIQHDLWRLTAPGAVAALQSALEPKALLLADGHHRYEVAMAYRDQVRRRNGSYTPEHPANFMLAFVAAFDAQDPGILPTHRVFSGISGWTVERLAAEPSLAVTRVPDDAALQAALLQPGDPAIPRLGCYAGRGQWAVVALARPDPAVQMDVELLHRVIVPRTAASAPTVAYHQAWADAARAVDQGRGVAAWRLRPPTLAQIVQCVRAGRRLPHKSTYFVPKPLAGLVVHLLRGAGAPPKTQDAAYADLRQA